MLGPLRRRLSVTLGAACFLTVWLYVWLRLDPQLLYFSFSPAFPPFLLTSRFFQTFLAHPGGLAEYVSAFLSQLFFYAWVGALVITAAAGLLCLTTWSFIAKLSGRRARALCFLPPLFLLFAYDRYVHALGPAVALLTATAFACLYVGIPLRGRAQRLLVFVLFCGAVYYAAGVALLVYAALCGVFEVATGGRRLLGVSCFPVGAAIPYVVGALGFGLRLRDAYWGALVFRQDSVARTMVFAFYLCLPLMAGGVALFDRISKSSRAGGIPRSPGKASPIMRPRRAASIALPVAAAAIIWFSFNAGAARWLRIERSSRLGNWADVLHEAHPRAGGQYDFMTNRAVNRALYHQHRLLDELCSYPQELRGLLYSPRQMDETLQSPYAPMRLSDTFLDLGLVNESEHMAQEAFDHVGPRPWVLQRLALTEIAKGRGQVVRLFLHVLSGDMMYGKWAAECLAGGEHLPPPVQDEVQRLRSLMVHSDTAGWLPTDTLLVGLLERNNRNQMAFEYLMAYYLLTKQLDRVAENIGRLGDFGYSRIPRHCEEALLLHALRTGRTADLRGLTISEATVARYAAFSRLIRDCGNDRAAAFQAAAREYGDTYFFHYVFSPLEAAQ